MDMTDVGYIGQTGSSGPLNIQDKGKEYLKDESLTFALNPSMHGSAIKRTRLDEEQISETLAPNSIVGILSSKGPLDTQIQTSFG